MPTSKDKERPAPKKSGKNRTAFAPEVEIKLDRKGTVQLRLNKAVLADLFDQSPDMLVEAGQGCISSPGGPSC
jgi:hypothetical protein